MASSMETFRVLATRIARVFTDFFLLLHTIRLPLTIGPD